MGETFVIDGDLLPGQASLHFPGEVYTAATTTKFQRGEASGDISDRGRGGGTGRAYHVVHLRLKTGDNKPAATHTATSPAQEASSTGSTNGDRQLAPIDDKERRLRGASVSSGCNKASEEVSSGPSSRASNAGSKLRVESSPPLSSSPKNPRPRSTSTPSKREEDCVSVLEAAGRAAMVGFHAHLAGAMRQLTWGEDELTLIADSIPAACSTLREACMSGGLYRTTGSGGQAKHTAQEEKPHASVVVDRILKLATQTAAAIAHCHRRGVSNREIRALLQKEIMPSMDRNSGAGCSWQGRPEEHPVQSEPSVTLPIPDHGHHTWSLTRNTYYLSTLRDFTCNMGYKQPTFNLNLWGSRR